MTDPGSAGPSPPPAIIVTRMPAKIEPLWPRWAKTVGVMLQRNILLRSQCRRCGTLMRVEPADLVARHGAGWSPIDHQERCRMVGCDGASYYLAARRIDTAWRVLLADPALIQGLDDLPAPVTARTLRGG
ncbi:hypothetical protein [Sphingobium sp. AP50]|uniref:hypothetical protein n=1 Tax=Sphingobium sp. AP50 TaxID=1884369 RepID=UPI00210C7DCB|nr:hypothetical protein [Sphingobium sp. AP50]